MPKKRKAPSRTAKPAPTREVVPEEVKRRARQRAGETLGTLERTGVIRKPRKPRRAPPSPPSEPKRPVYAPIKQAAIGSAQDRYTQAVRELREAFTGFESGDGFNLREFDSWSEAQKRKVRRYYTTLDQARSHVHQKVRQEDLPEGHQDRATFEKVLEQTQQREHVKKWKVAYVPAPGAREYEKGHRAPVDVMVDEDTGEIWIEQEGYAYRQLDFDMVDFVQSPSETLAHAIAEQSPQAARYQVIAGKHKYGSYTRDELLRYVEWMLANYEDAEEWFGGVVALDFSGDERAAGYTTAKGLLDRYTSQQQQWKKARRFYREGRKAIELQLKGVRRTLRRQGMSADDIKVEQAFQRDYLLDQLREQAIDKGYPPEDELK